MGVHLHQVPYEDARAQAHQRAAAVQREARARANAVRQLWGGRVWGCVGMRGTWKGAMDVSRRPPARQQGDVVIVRLSLLCVETGSASAVQLATNDYTFGIAALSPPPPPPAKGCTIDTGFDWKPNLPGQRVVSAKDAGECCHACAAQPGCKAGSLFDGRCWLKDEAAAVSKFAKPGVTSCQPSNRTVVAQHAHSPLAAHEGKAGPLRAMLDVANASLSLTVVGNVMHVSTANESSSSPCALYVKPTLRNATGHQLGYVTFSQGFQIMRPGEAAALQVVTAGVGLATHACVEAWNAPRVCAALPI